MWILNELSFLVPQINMDILFHELTIHGFMISSYKEEFHAALAEMASLVKKVGKIKILCIYYDCFSQDELKFKETVFDGFENMPKAFVGLFKGENTGKAVVKASNYP